MNITKVSTENCTACCLCQNVCPANAISMSENQEGFLYPHIDFQNVWNVVNVYSIVQLKIQNI